MEYAALLPLHQKRPAVGTSAPCSQLGGPPAGILTRPVAAVLALSMIVKLVREQTATCIHWLSHQPERAIWRAF